MSQLTFTHIRKTFGPTVALESFDLDIREGELVSLLGPSGCGKTTALRICAGFERADAGSMTVGGADITHLPAHRRNMGMVFQSYSLFPNLTVAGNVEYGLRTRRVAAAERRSQVAAMLDIVQLSGMAKRYPHQLSGGQQQRVALARALAVKPQVLLLDEPLSALDAQVRTTLRDEIRRIQSELGITTLFVTHDQEEALGISDRVCVMSQGRLEQVGTPTDVYRRPATPFVARFVGSINALPATVIGESAVRVAHTVVAVPVGSFASPGDEIRILVRPEDLHVADHGLFGTVASVTFQGASTIVRVRVDVLDELLTVHTSGDRASSVAVGDRVSLSIDGRHARCESIAFVRPSDT